MPDREKLIELLYRAHHNASAVMAGGEGSYHDGLKEEADYLIANGVTIQKMPEKEEAWESSKT